MDSPSPRIRFRPHQRLRTPAGFRRVMDAPALRASHSGFVLLACENGLPEARIGFVLPKRRVRTAVARNRVKRIIRESFRCHQVLLAGLDIVVMARDGLAALAPAELRTAADRQFQYLAGKRRPLRDETSR
ncbi:MAG: ribonuclease P protein component [Pseudomonadota bacterium]